MAVELSIEEYEAVRARPDDFAVIPKLDAACGVAAKLDPRSRESS